MNLDLLETFRECWEKIESVGNEYALAKSQSWHMQESTSSVRAVIMAEFDNDMAVSRMEIKAKCDPRYIKHLQDTQEAINKEYRLKASVDRWKAKFEGYRSLSSLEKALLNKE